MWITGIFLIDVDGMASAVARAKLTLDLLDEFQVQLVLETNLGEVLLPEDFPAPALDLRCTKGRCQGRERLWARGDVVKYLEARQ